MTPDRARQSVDWLFKKFHLYYGRRWVDSYAGMSIDEVAGGWAEELQAFSEQEVVRGATACKTSKFPPTLPEFLSFCRPATASNRPSGDESWAIAIRAADESETVVWTEEIATAWGICQPVFQSGDEIGARMAFRAAYERITADARVSGTPARWIVSEGHDADRRVAAIQQAQVAGLLPAAVAQQYVPLIESRLDPIPSVDVANRIAELKAALSMSARPNREPEYQRTKALKSQAAQKLAQYQGQQA